MWNILYHSSPFPVGIWGISDKKDNMDNMVHSKYLGKLVNTVLQLAIVVNATISCLMPPPVAPGCGRLSDTKDDTETSTEHTQPGSEVRGTLGTLY